ncbi:glycoside hydrolase family 78 protein [Winslowiella iniecta]|uniref:alpha-L-rhamnosidase n=1 Tax=Winslowiella iniecta TaxID=1560201 RepID=A0A0L7T5F4_9GAMM|nr:glycoside hydrolase family 78 protein [Winslowiella iniecta]KOC88543.1 hypothetical protein NG42_15910 [Winslowiella iniecta]KOC90578.1 hypothetical protein NG43_17080 [Winslowiella iniecta]
MSGLNLTDVQPYDVHFDYHAAQPVLGIGSSQPRLSWKLPELEAGYQQHACELDITIIHADQSRYHDTFVVSGAEQICVDWPAQALRSRDRVAVKVRVSDGQHWSAWSDSALAEVGLLQPDDWTAKVIHSGIRQDRYKEECVYQLRKAFSVSQPVERATLYVTALGLAEIEINGKKVGDDALLPGWTSYPHRLRYFTYDVTELLDGEHLAIGIWLADGWYAGRFGFHGGNARLYGDKSGLLLQLEILHADGSQSRVISDDSWRCALAPITASSLYNGESFDATRHDTRWSQPGFDSRLGQPVEVADYFNYQRLIAPEGPPVRAQQTLQPVEIIHQPDGHYLLDFGQNFSGRLQINVKGKRGQRITLRHAEVLQEGKIYRRPLRGAASEDSYIIGADNVSESWQPRFTLHGFRYVEVEGWPADTLNKADIVAQVYYSDMKQTGHFSCSHAGINQLHSNVLWSMRSNFVDIPTDCPQRDERLGWTGDIQVFTPTASFLYDVRGFLSSWLKDLAIEQQQFGNVPWYVPWIPGNAWQVDQTGSVWGDVATITPWVLYERYQDIGIIRQQYNSAKMWCDRLIQNFAADEYIVRQDLQLGDWLDPLAPPDNPIKAMTDTSLIATAYAFKSFSIMSRMAERLDKPDEAKYYATMASHTQQDFLQSWFDETGICVNETQCAYSIALVFGLLNDEGKKKVAGERLAKLIRQHGGKIGTGFAGTPIVLDALTLTGHLAEAYQMLECQDCPSWLYQVDMGATTIWERWDSMLPDGSVNPGEMTSFNHYALGSVADWLHRVVGGIENIGSGYNRIRFQPQPGGQLSWAKSAFDSPYGLIKSHWSIADGKFTLDVSVPTGSTAIVKMPDGKQYEVANGQYRYQCDYQ